MDMLQNGAVGGVSALLTFIIMKIIKKEQKWIFTFIFIISFIITKILLGPYIEHYGKYNNVDNLLSKIEPFATVKIYDKKEYDDIINRFIKGNSSNIEQELYLKQFISLEVSTLLNKRLKYTSNDEIFNYYKSSFEALKYLSNYKKTYCYDWAFPSQYIGFDKIFTAELVDKIKNTYTEVIKSSYTKEKIKNNVEESLELNEIGQLLRYKYGENISLLQNPNLVDNEQKKETACDILLDLYTAIFSLDKDKSINILYQMSNN